LKFPEHPPAVNGHQAAPPNAGGVFLPAQQRTVFPADQVRVSLTTLLYCLARQQIGGMPLIRLPQWLLLIAAGLWAPGWLPGRWWVTGLCLVMLLALQLALVRLRRHDFVLFTASAQPVVTPQALAARPKIPIYATGQFSVENKSRQFTWLPGFYRTFATREHALMCQVAGRTLLPIGRWPETEIGLWYVFFTPPEIQQVRWGKLAFGRTALPAIAVTYRSTSQPPPRRRANDSGATTVYLAFQQEDDGRTILADLLYDLRRDRSPAPAE
jgi:hypothetical protein